MTWWTNLRLLAGALALLFFSGWLAVATLDPILAKLLDRERLGVWRCANVAAGACVGWVVLFGVAWGIRWLL